MTRIETFADARRYTESILHADAKPEEIERVAEEVWNVRSCAQFRERYPDDSPQWLALLDEAAAAVSPSYEIRNLRPSSCGLEGPSFRDGDVYCDGVDTGAEVTMAWEEHNGRWAPYGNHPDMWHSLGNEADQAALDGAMDAIYALTDAPEDGSDG